MAVNGLVTGSADYRGAATQRAREIMARRDRARAKAYTRLANLHPHEWTTLLTAALDEEGIAPDTTC